MARDPKEHQRAAGAALAARRGDIEASILDDTAKALYDTMTVDELEELAMTGTSDPRQPARRLG